MNTRKPLWVRMELGMDDDPVVQRIADLTGLDEFGVLGRLYKLREVMFRRGDQSDIVPYSPGRLDRLLAHDGFADALIAVGILVEQDHGILTMPGFWEEYSIEGNRRAVAARQKANQRNASSVESSLYNKEGDDDGEETEVGRPSPVNVRTKRGQTSDKSRTKAGHKNKRESLNSPPTPPRPPEAGGGLPPPGAEGYPPAPLSSSGACASGDSESPPVSGSASAGCSGFASASSAGSASDGAALSAPEAQAPELERFVEAVRACRPEWRGEPGRPLVGLKPHELALAREAAADCGAMFVDHAEVIARYMAAPTERSSAGEAYWRPRRLHKMFDDARVVVGHATLWERERKRRLR